MKSTLLMKAMVLRGPGELALDEVALPPVREGQVLGRAARETLCIEMRRKWRRACEAVKLLLCNQPLSRLKATPVFGGLVAQL